MGVAILTNYQALTGGFSWDGFVGPARDSGPFHFGVFLVYIALLVVAVMNLLTGMFVQPKAALDALCGVTCVTSVTMQGSMGTVSDTDSEVVYELTSIQKLSMFPQTHDYMAPSGKVIKQELFGKSIVLVDHILVKKQATVGCFPFYVAHVFLRRRHQMALEAMLKARIVAGLNFVNVLQHTFLLMSAKHFLETPLKDLHGLHEQQRNRGYLVYLAYSEAIQGFKALGRFIIFFSYQWLS